MLLENTASNIQTARNAKVLLCADFNTEREKFFSRYTSLSEDVCQEDLSKEKNASHLLKAVSQILSPFSTDKFVVIVT